MLQPTRLLGEKSGSTFGIADLNLLGCICFTAADTSVRRQCGA